MCSFEDGNKFSFVSSGTIKRLIFYKPFIESKPFTFWQQQLYCTRTEKKPAFSKRLVCVSSLLQKQIIFFESMGCVLSFRCKFRSLFINETFFLQPNISCQCKQKQENRIYFEWNRSLVRRMYIKGPSPLIRPRGIITNSHFWTYSTILSCPLHYSS